MPYFFPQWPEYNIKQVVLADGHRQVAIEFRTFFKDIVDVVTFAIYCPNGTQCVDAWDWLRDVAYIKSEMSNATAVIQVTGLGKWLNLTFNLNTAAPVVLDIMYSLEKKTIARTSFMTEYGQYVQHAADGRGLGGTVFVHTQTLTQM
jgi:hypothetical protein